MSNKRFSTANLVMLCVCISFIVSLFYKNQWNIDTTEKILFGISASCFAALSFFRFPLYIMPNKTDFIKENLYDEKYISKISFLKYLIYLFLTLETSDLESLFASSILKLYKKDRICKFIWDKDKAKFFHKILDICVLPIMLFVAVTSARLIIKFNVISFLILDLVILVLNDRVNLLVYAMSVKIIDNIYVICPYSSSKVKVFKYYGFAFMKKIFITADTYRFNPVVKNYVIAHEEGHTRNGLMSILNRVISVFNLFFTTLTPFFLRDFLGINNPILYFVPVFLVLIYALTLRNRIIECDEFAADKFAIKKIGKKSCIEALNILNKEQPRNRSGLIRKIFPRSIAIERRIKFINGCEDKNKY